ncbi:dipeptidyl aminopeptidase dapB [Aspergillus candidus]|uniref:dipeptidyl-peptidase IV n=1 Tax=Aspergillus candidus TaxID=41067 RepID=A0A2I2FCG1_ASPCN|nr:dipeptidyl peptidase IV N-terminal region-domain-containing protein [Aspergillus candidus]PLB38321.1 dipeptidyl peptidase IV N-terminal region-domain-containing protein [Aspergillus candidus]
MGKYADDELSEFYPMTRQRATSSSTQSSSDSGLSVESDFLRGDGIPGFAQKGEEGHGGGHTYRDMEEGDPDADEPFLQHPNKTASSSRARRIIWAVALLCVGAWVAALVGFLITGRPDKQSRVEAAELNTTVAVAGSQASGEPVTLSDVVGGRWYPRSHAISWIAGPKGEDGLLVEQGESSGGDYLRVVDIGDEKDPAHIQKTRVLMKEAVVHVGDTAVYPSTTWPSPDLKKVLLLSSKEKNWRHSYTGLYWIFDVESQTAVPLDPSLPDARVQLAQWSPKSDAVVFSRDNNMYLRKLSSEKVIPITKDGGANLFYGVPDWVYEEEVLAGNSATWWSNDGNYVAFFRTNESAVPEYPVDYFLSRPSGKKPLPGLENYPEVRQIKYPKAGAPNPVVNLQFYDVQKSEVFPIEVNEDFADDDRIIIEIVWATASNALVRATNRESDIVKIFLIDTKSRTGKLVREEDIAGLDGGWVEPSQTTKFIPADPKNGRPHDGYVDTVVHEGYDHLAYFAPLDSKEPVMLTSGKWEVVDAPSAVDLRRGLVYFIAAKEAPTERHVYRVQLDGSNLKPLTDTSNPGYYDVSFSDGAAYGLLSYKGPSIPWQSIISMEGEDTTTLKTIEKNPDLARMVNDHAMPTENYTEITVDGYKLQVVERLPPQFDPSAKYPVLFHLYGGPGSQTVDRKFKVDFQSYIASSLGYIVVTVDGRGTGYIGREARCAIRGNIGHYEARDQIMTAKAWGEKPYVDKTRMAIWGWSYGGFMTLKTLEKDAGETFQYGMAVAPVTDWRFYDSIYTERYMHTPEHNPSGYENATIADMAALKESTRFLVMHGASDDNVHLQNTLTLVDKLDLSSVDNYDLHFFPDSDHSIAFHNAHSMVYGRLSNWLVNAFNGEWNRIANPVPEESAAEKVKRAVSELS